MRTTVNQLPRFYIECIAESLVATGHLRSLAALNVASSAMYAHTLPILWRTIIWDPKRKDLELRDGGKEGYWKQIMVDGEGARHIQ
jgi:hypothetical protein